MRGCAMLGKLRRVDDGVMDSLRNSRCISQTVRDAAVRYTSFCSPMIPLFGAPIVLNVCRFIWALSSIMREQSENAHIRV